MPEKSRVAVIGGGIAGISAAVELLERGYTPIVFERAAALGGRARSLLAKDINRMVDNGQHVLSASYEETRKLLKRLGSDGAVNYQRRLAINYRLGRQHFYRFRTWPLPPPFHFLLPLLMTSPLGERDRRNLRRLGAKIRNARPFALRDLTAGEWLDDGEDSSLLRELLWSPIALATLNTPLHQCSALLFQRVVNTAFLGSTGRCGLGLPAVMLSELFGEPALNYIWRHGGEVHTHTPVQRLLMDGRRVVGLASRNVERSDFDHCIAAIPPDALKRLLTDSGTSGEQMGLALDRFQFSPIITISLWVDRHLDIPCPVALVNSPLHWLFQIPVASAGADEYGYTVVISAATPFVGSEAGYLLELLSGELNRFFGLRSGRDYHILASKVIKEKFATILQTPESLKWRPAAATTLENFFLAGDWTDTGLPATIEGAVLSGRIAAEKLAAGDGIR